MSDAIKTIGLICAMMAEMVTWGFSMYYSVLAAMDSGERYILWAILWAIWSLNFSFNVRWQLRKNA